MEILHRNKFYKNQRLLLLLAFSLILVLIVPKIHFSVADEVLPNFVLIYDQPWLYQNTNILDVGHRQKLISDLSTANCKYAVVFIGYWDATDPTNPLISPTLGALSGPQNYVRTPIFYQELIAQLHEIGIKVFCWIEDGVGLMDISPANRPNIFHAIFEAVNIGFDGFTDDVENWVGHSDGSTAILRQADYDVQIDYLNNVTTVLHDNGKLHAPAVGFDWEQYVNQRLHVDFILSMFYSDRTTLADSQCDIYWRENLGIYGNVSASPLVVGLFMHKENNPAPYDTMAGMLVKVDSLLDTYPHPMLYGFFIWIYEYMDDADWTSWNSWVSTLPGKDIPPTAQASPFPSPTQSPTPTPTPTPTAEAVTSPAPTPTLTASPSSPHSEEMPAVIYIVIGIIAAVVGFTVIAILLRMRK
jgi:hypothetical protein